ncbi:MAG: hypothetical protein ACPLYX_00130 [Rectinema subterraneum]|uniref:hypothetical protein n=1 Tax=Rectinema subterraneum TaxID=2653714 RepID=UPI003C7BA1B9
MRGCKKYFFDMPRMAAALNKSLIWFFTALLTSLLAFSCGLPTAGDYLDPPTNFFNSGSNNITLIHAGDNNFASSNFLGYEIYYRLFENLEDAKKALSTILNLAANNPNNPDNFMQNVLNSPSIPFHRMLKLKVVLGQSDIDFSRPLLPAAGSTNAQFNLDLTTWTVNNTPTKIVRNKGDSSVDSADFSVSANYNSKDQDYTGSDSPQTVYIALFAVSYGISEDSLGNALYSEPVIIDAPVEYTPNS